MEQLTNPKIYVAKRIKNSLNKMMKVHEKFSGSETLDTKANEHFGEVTLIILKEERGAWAFALKTWQNK